MLVRWDAAKAWYFFYFASLVSVGPFLNVYLNQDVGLSKQQIGVIGALRPWISAPASFAWAALADRFHCHQLLLLTTFVASTAIRLLIVLPTAFVSILGLLLVVEVVSAPVGIMADAAVVQACAKEGDYGKYRLWGAVGWGFFSTVGGWLIDRYGFTAAVVAHALFALPCLYLTPMLHAMRKPGARTQPSGHRQQQQPSQHGAAGREHGRDEERAQLLPHGGDAAAELAVAPAELHAAGEVVHRAKAHAAEEGAADGSHGPPVGSSGADGGKRFWQDLTALAQNPGVLLFLFVACCMGWGFGVIDSMLFLYLAQLGGSDTLMGLTLTITCIAEVPAFHFQDRLLDRLGVTAVLDLVQLVYSLRLLLYALLPLLGPRCVLFVLPVEVLHGITFAFGWGAGTVNCKQLAAGTGLAATLQGAFQSAYFGLGYGLGSLLGGAISTRLGLRAMFGVASATMLGLWVCTLAVRKLFGISLSVSPDVRPRGGYTELAARNGKDGTTG